MKPKRMIFMVILTILFFASSSNAATAASVDLDLPIQSALDVIKASADSATKIKISTLYNELMNYQEQAKSSEIKASDIHYKNDEALSLLLQQIKEVDATIVANLEADLVKAKDRYRPFLNVSTPLTTMFGRKVKLVTTAAQLARIDIQSKQNALKKAKDNKANTVRKIRTTLAEIDPLKVQIKSAKSNVSLHKTRITAAGKSFNQAVKKDDIKSAMDWLTTLSSLSRQIVEQKQNIYTIEQKISAIIVRAQAQVPA
jgi:DNA repair exonuclease SbcCD ATPase subunit